MKHFLDYSRRSSTVVNWLESALSRRQSVEEGQVRSGRQHSFRIFEHLLRRSASAKVVELS